MNYAALASAASVNLNLDLIRQNNLRYLEEQVTDLAVAYLNAVRADDTETAELLKARGVEMRRRLRIAQQRDRLG